MTPEVKSRLNQLMDKYRYCFMVHGAFHSKPNERRMQQFIDNKNPKEHEFVRVSADLTYVFWNPHKHSSIKCLES